MNIWYIEFLYTRTHCRALGRRRVPGGRGPSRLLGVVQVEAVVVELALVQGARGRGVGGRRRRVQGAVVGLRL